MTAKQKVFLSVADALAAIESAFQQYPFSSHLLAAIWPLVYGETSYVHHDAGSRSVWIKLPDGKKMLPSSEQDVKDRLVWRLRQSPPSVRQLAQIGVLVFGAGVSTESGKTKPWPAGIWVNTGMRGFICRRCGHCCHYLNYRDGCRVSDYQRWKAAGRNDLLDHVQVQVRQGTVVACRIWIDPETKQFTETCPWLKRVADRNEYACTIHADRPFVCRQYPGSRKHARLTGCRGVFS